MINGEPIQTKTMKNYKINMNRKPLCEEDIAKGKNFNQVLKNYHGMKTPFLKSPKFWFGASAVLVASIAALVIINKMTIGAQPVQPVSAFINPPIPGADIKSSSYFINTESDTVINYTSGSKLRIPAHAFMDGNGNLVKGQVELHYREFHQISEAFLAGIPMTYDSAGVQYNFETAGMMDISASQNNQSLLPNPNALISVSMASLNKEDRFNTYYLDTVERKWKYVADKNYQVTRTVVQETEADTAMSLAVVRLPENTSPEIKKLEGEIASIKQEKLVEPKRAEHNKPRFTIKVDEKEFPEIAVYNNIKFEVDDKGYDTSKTNILWENVELAHLPGSNNYAITFSTSRQKYTVVATPVFADKDYAAAKNVYDAKYAEYQDKLGKRREEEARLKAELAMKAKEMQQQIQRQIATQDSITREYMSRVSQGDLVFRTFQVNRFGFWNSDCPSYMPAGANVMASLIDARTGKPLGYQDCYLVEKGRNAMFCYHPGSLNSFRFNPAKDNMVWVVTNDMKVAVIKPEQFKASKITGNKMELELNVIDKKFKTTDEAKEYLEI